LLISRLMRVKKNLVLLLSVLTLNRSISNTALPLSSSSSSSIMSSIKKIPQNKLGVSEPPPDWFGNEPNVCLSSWTNKNWLKSRFHFSFAEYSNPRNMQYGVLRVMNDDLVQPLVNILIEMWRFVLIL